MQALQWTASWNGINKSAVRIDRRCPCREALGSCMCGTYRCGWNSTKKYSTHRGSGVNSAVEIRRKGGSLCHTGKHGYGRSCNEFQQNSKKPWECRHRWVLKPGAPECVEATNATRCRRIVLDTCPAPLQRAMITSCPNSISVQGWNPIASTYTHCLLLAQANLNDDNLAVGSMLTFGIAHAYSPWRE